MRTRKGDTWNESEELRDGLTLRRKRRLTTTGAYNNAPTYHTNTAWTHDGQHVVFLSERDSACALFRAEACSGDITQLTEWLPNRPEIGMRGIMGTTALAPKAGLLTYRTFEELRTVDIFTLEERVIVHNMAPYSTSSVPAIDPDERWVVVDAVPWHPAQLAGVYQPKRDTHQLLCEPGRSSYKLLRVPLDGSAPVEVLYEEQGCVALHVQWNPVHPEWLIYDRKFLTPLDEQGFRYHKVKHLWSFHLPTRQLTDLGSPTGADTQVHSCWTWDGSAAIYHCPTPNGYVIGLVSPSGECLWEHQSSEWKYYGHVGAMAGRPAILLDGNLTQDMLLWMYYDTPEPRVEIVCRHGTQWNGAPGQHSHPHPVSDPTGRYVAYNVGDRGRSDVWLVEV